MKATRVLVLLCSLLGCYGDDTLFFQPSSGKTTQKLRDVICPDQSTCPDGQTCCKLASGQYGCCPYRKAVCCSDRQHCCPNGYTCDVAHRQCIPGSLDISHVMALAKITALDYVLCPDKRSTCQNNATCCIMSSGQYGCCPMPKAVCCKDHLHCCPHHTHCNLEQQSCDRPGNMAIPWQRKRPAMPYRGQRLNDIVCPGGKSSCPEGSTCCAQKSGGFGCCPLPKAVCCSDGEHCCPSGYHCDTTKSLCLRDSDDVIKMTKTTVALTKPPPVQKCPDGSRCPAGSTCCESTGGKYACCPHVEAVCCSDHVHCCAKGYTCDAGKCNKGTESVPFSLRTPSISADNVICPDGQSECPSGSTCCRLASGQYGCCPLPQAVCCSDHVHCCPNGYTCAGGQCARGTETVPFSVKTPALHPDNVICPDGQSECPSGSTCCVLASGQYGCCPLPQAVCCSDHVHCCPNGYTCAGGQCTRGTETVPFSIKTPALRANNVICPDQQSECPSGSTCCVLASGQYGCCPLPQAVCCSDHVHCCPNGFTCQEDKCARGTETVPFSVKTSALHANNVICPDQQSECPSGSTCCVLASRQYGCCPLPQAVCCSDHLHCCPHGYKCGQAHCEGETGSVPFSVKLPAKTPALRTEAKEVPLGVKTPAQLITATSLGVRCHDHRTQCPNNTSCCLLASGQYGCCPFKHAVCCSDHIHCCPQHMTCDLKRGMCAHDESSLAFSLMPFSRKTAQVLNVICPDGKSQCPDGNTCCMMKSGVYGCCSYSSATCCSEHDYCCPHGYRCDVSRQACFKTDGSTQPVPWTKKPSPLVTKPVGYVVCPDHKTMCEDKYTCCPMVGGAYGCCPYQKGVCCADKLHCCPSGMTCDPAAGMCRRGGVAISANMFTRHRALPIPDAPADAGTEEVRAPSTATALLCPDKLSRCPYGFTCCQLPGSKQYGCCPFAKAVCCPDKIHCCPGGYECNDGKMTCVRGTETALMALHLKVKATKAEVKVAQPVGTQKCGKSTVTCPDEYTCCKDGASYGCCPLKEAVCCSDGLHCCPRGTRCDVSAGRCLSTQLSIPWLNKLPAEASVQKIPVSVKTKAEQDVAMETKSIDRVGVILRMGVSLPAREMKKAPSTGAIICPDHRHECPDLSTCCRMRTGEWGCCPYPNAQCCRDGEHCCPRGYHCDLRRQICFQNPSGEANNQSSRSKWIDLTRKILGRN